MPFDRTPGKSTDHDMTLEEMEQIGKRAEGIKHAAERLKKAERKLETLLKHKDKKKDTSWKPTLVLERSGNWAGDVTVEFEIPYAMVEQQLVDAVKRAKRELILLGGRP